VSFIEKVFVKLRIESGYQFVMVNVVFAVTGTLSVYCSGYLLFLLGIEVEILGAGLYWLARILTVFLCYQCLLILIAVPFGQFQYFWFLQKKMLKRLGLDFD